MRAGRPVSPHCFSCSHRFRLLGPFGNSAEFLRFVQRAAGKAGLGGFCVSATKSLYTEVETAIFPHLSKRVCVCAPRTGGEARGRPGSPGSSRTARATPTSSCPTLPVRPRVVWPPYAGARVQDLWETRGTDLRHRVCTSVGRKAAPVTSRFIHVRTVSARPCEPITNSAARPAQALHAGGGHLGRG